MIIKKPQKTRFYKMSTICMPPFYESVQPILHTFIISGKTGLSLNLRCVALIKLNKYRG